jgi:hypothetical protein
MSQLSFNFTAAPAQTSFQDFIKEIKQLAFWNCHTDAIVLLSKRFGDALDQADADYVKQVHTAQGSMPRDVSDFRYDLYKRLLKKAHRVLTSAEYGELYLAL